MVREKIKHIISTKENIVCLIISSLLFSIVYNFCGWYASHSDRAKSFILDFEYNIPFLPWMVIPYMSSGILFGIVFFCCPSRKELFLLTQRINFITIISGIIFIVFPLKHTFVKPDVNSTFLNFFFQFLNTWDTNYNQAPSLHISYALLFGSIFSYLHNKVLKNLIYGWLILLGISTLTIFQHHLIDIIASYILISITFFIFPKIKSRSYKIGMFYNILSSLLLFTTLFVYQYMGLFALLTLWISLILFLIGYTYCTSNHYFLKSKNGIISYKKKILFFPYILTYKIIRAFFCRNNKNSVTEVFPSLFIGPMFSQRIMTNLGFNDKHTIVIDLAAEVEESQLVRQHTIYYCYPTLDITDMEQQNINNIITKISQIYNNKKAEEVIYMHCLMGYSRCAYIAILFISRQTGISIKEAASQLKKEYPNAILPLYLLTLTKNKE